MSLRGSVQKQAQYGPDRLNKPRARSDEELSPRTRLAKEARSQISGEPDRRGAGRPVEAYTPILVGRNVFRI